MTLADYCGFVYRDINGAHSLAYDRGDDERARGQWPMRHGTLGDLVPHWFSGSSHPMCDSSAKRLSC